MINDEIQEIHQWLNRSKKLRLVEEEIEYIELQEIYFSLQKLNVKLKGKQDERLPETFKRFKQFFCPLLTERENEKVKADKEKNRKIASSQASLWDQAQEIFYQ